MTDHAQLPSPQSGWIERGRFVPKVAALRAKLYALAKGTPTYRFYSLYGQLLRGDVLQAAWDQVAFNNGAPGVDGVTVSSIVNTPGGVAALLTSVQQSLQTRTYKPAAVKRIYIPKANGKLRPLGIPTIRDRVVQTAVKIILEPIFEADFLPCSHGYRPGRSAHGAVRQVIDGIHDGRQAIYDMDLTSYFDTIPHDKLFACVRRRVTDGSILALIRAWLTATVVEDDEHGGGHRRWRPRAGTPQGGVISPLLANLYLHWVDKLFHASTGPLTWANARLVRFADDLVIQARYISARLRTWIETTVEGRFGLTINREKTAERQVSPDRHSGVDFLGYHIWHAPGYLRPGTYLTANPSPKAMEAARGSVRKIICRCAFGTPIDLLIQRVNQFTTGWDAYFHHGRPAHQYWQLNTFIEQAFIRHLKRRSQRPYRPPAGTTWWHHLTEQLGWKPLKLRPDSQRHETVRKAGCGKSTSPV